MTTRHYEAGDWVDYTRGLVEETARAQMSQHLAECAGCETTAVTFGRLATMRVPPEPSELAVERALSIFKRPHPSQAAASQQPTRVRPRLLYDSHLAGAPLGTRRAGRETRRQLLEVGAYFLDLDLALRSRTAGPGELMLVGQLVDRAEPGRAVPEFLARLEGRRGPLVQSESNALGEFELVGDARSAVRLAIALEDAEIELDLPRLEDGRSRKGLGDLLGR